MLDVYIIKAYFYNVIKIKKYGKHNSIVKKQNIY
jgi:hypothetical protein